MVETGWRTIRIASHASVGISDNALCVCQDEKVVFPLKQIRSVIVETQDISISSKAITELMKAHVQLIFCDEKHNPVCEGTPYHSHTYSAGNLMRQAEWPDATKDRLWEEIVRQKLSGQRQLMEATKPGTGELLTQYMDRLTPGDTGNCEAIGAGLYFRTLFGYCFSRGSSNPVNGALNYGYAILLSTVNRALSLYGYRSELGIHHRSEVNPFNLACDLMEPFRPLVDAVVLSMEMDGEELTADKRAALVAWQYDVIQLEHYRYTANDAIALFVKDCIDYMNGDTDRIREVGLFE